MRKYFILSIVTLFGLLPDSFGQVLLVDTQRVLISQSIVAGNSSSILDIWAKNKGLLIPRSDYSTIIGINNPAKGLILVDTINNYIYEYNGSSWDNINEVWLINYGNLYTNSKTCFGCTVPVMKMEVGGSISISNGKSYRINNIDVLHEKGTGNLAMGLYANSSDSSGSYNTTLGEEAGKFISSGQRNTLLGYQSGLSVTTSHDNSYVGYNVGYNNNSGSNVFLGNESGYYNTGGGNVLAGYKAGYGVSGQSTADTNVVIGYKAGYGMTSSSKNTIAGNEAAYTLNTGTNNVILGRRSGYSLTNGDGNVFIGDSAGFSMTTADSAVFVGMKAGLRCTASLNVAIGDSAMSGLIGTNVTGDKNICYGHASGARLTSGELNVMGGYRAGFKGASTSKSVFLGDYSGYNNTTGTENVYLGYGAGYNNNNSGNVFLGYQAGYNTSASSRLIVENSSSASPLISGDFNQDSLRFNSDVTIRDFLNLNKGTISLSQNQSLSPANSFLELSANSAITLNTTTAIVDGNYLGQVLVVQGTSNTNTITINTNANTKLSSATIILGTKDRLMLIWDGNDWVQITYSNN